MPTNANKFTQSVGIKFVKVCQAGDRYIISTTLYTNFN